MATNHHHRHTFLLDQPIEIRPRDIENLGSLLGRQQSVMRQNYDCLNTVEGVKQASRHSVKGRRHQALFTVGSDQPPFAGLKKRLQLVQRLWRHGIWSNGACSGIQAFFTGFGSRSRDGVQLAAE